MQIKPNKSPMRNTFLALLLSDIGHLFSRSRSCLGRLIHIRGGLGGPPPHTLEYLKYKLIPQPPLLPQEAPRSCAPPHINTSLEDLWGLSFGEKFRMEGGEE